MTTAAIQGLRGSYSEEAALGLLNLDVRIAECQSVGAVIDAVLSGSAELAVLPVENKIIGPIGTVPLISASGLRELDRLRLPIQHVLSGCGDATFADLRVVRSQAEALRQCQRYLASNPQIVTEIAADTALAVRDVAGANDHSIAAIGSSRAVALYSAKILQTDIADDPHNWTDFSLLSI